MNDITAPVMDTSNIAVINTNIIYIQRDISDIKLSLKDAYATKDQLKEIADRTTRLEGASNLWRWLSPTLAAGAAFVLEFLLQSYLTHLK